MIFELGNRLCQRAIPLSEFKDLYSALVCGTAVTDASTRRLFLDTGLIHLLVVSGAHLHFLDRYLQWLPLRIRLFSFGLYAWLCGFNPPVMRAWVRRIFDHFCQSVGFSPFQIEALTILTVAFLSPQGLNSRSLLMCWVCAIALNLPHPWPKWPSLSVSFWCYVLLLPLAPSAPTTLFYNVAITPIVGNLLFPLSLLACLVPGATWISDPFWRVFLGALDLLPQIAPPPMRFQPWLFLYPTFLHLTLLRLEIPWRRARAFSSS